MRESPNGMASAFEGLSRFARERVSIRRPAEGTPLGVSADTRLSGARIRAHLAPFQHVSCFGHLRLSKLPRTRV